MIKINKNTWTTIMGTLVNEAGGSIEISLNNNKDRIDVTLNYQKQQLGLTFKKKNFDKFLDEVKRMLK